MARYGIGWAACHGAARGRIAPHPARGICAKFSGGAARELFQTGAWPALGRCAGCHASQPSIDFQQGGDLDVR